MNVVQDGQKSEQKSHYRTLTKTRKYMTSDGQMVTVQTQKVVLSGEENKARIEHDIW